jgi:hypothetical protein
LRKPIGLVIDSEVRKKPVGSWTDPAEAEVGVA